MSEARWFEVCNYELQESTEVVARECASLDQNGLASTSLHLSSSAIYPHYFKLIVTLANAHLVCGVYFLRNYFWQVLAGFVVNIISVSLGLLRTWGHLSADRAWVSISTKKVLLALAILMRILSSRSLPTVCSLSSKIFLWRSLNVLPCRIVDIYSSRLDLHGVNLGTCPLFASQLFHKLYSCTQYQIVWYPVR